MGRGIKLNSGVGSAGALFSLILLFSSGSVFVGHSTTDGHLLHFRPGLSKLSALEASDLMEVVLNLNDELRFALSVRVLESTFSNVVTSQLGGESLHELGKVVGVVVVVEEAAHVTELVLEGHALGHGEVRADGEEFHRFLLVGLVSEVVGDTEGECVVVLDGEASGSEGGTEHSSLHGGSFSNTLKGLEGTEKLGLLEDLLEDGGDDGGTGAITEELDGVDISKVELGELNSLSADHGEPVSDGLNPLFHFIAFDVSVKVLLIEEVINTDVGFSISSEYLSGLLGSLHNAELASDIFHRIVLVLFVEFSSALFHDSVIEVSSTEVPV